jgi:hypothetical protein
VSFCAPASSRSRSFPCSARSTARKNQKKSIGCLWGELRLGDLLFELVLGLTQRLLGLLPPSHGVVDRLVERLEQKAAAVAGACRRRGRARQDRLDRRLGLVERDKLDADAGIRAVERLDQRRVDLPLVLLGPEADRHGLARFGGRIGRVGLCERGVDGSGRVGLGGAVGAMVSGGPLSKPQAPSRIAAISNRAGVDRGRIA